MSRSEGQQSFSARYGSRPSGDTEAKRQRARFLFYSGWAIVLLYLPSGLLHFLLGRGVYGRDLLLLAHAVGCLHWMWRNEELKPFLRRHWPLFVPALIILPAFADGNSRVEALTFVKWGLLWLDWLLIGYLSRYSGGFTTTAKVMLGLTMALLAADLGCGVYERATDTFVISGEADERTAFGVMVDLEHHIGDQLRVKGLQRDIFSFANLMGASAVLGLLFFINVTEVNKRLPALLWSLACTVMLVMSGGRSAFFGMLAVILAVSSLLIAPEWTRRHYRRLILGWLLVCLIFSSVGVGEITDAIGGSVFQSKGVGNAGSAYLRDKNWAGIMDAIGRVPVVLMFGSSLSSMFDPRVEVFYHWADNQFFWLLYHTGVFGFGAIIWYFWTAVGTGRRQEADQTWVYDGLVLFLLYVMGEAIARESLTFIGCLPVFVAIGCCDAARRRAAQSVEMRPSSSSSERRRSSSSSAASEMRRRIQAKLNERK